MIEIFLDAEFNRVCSADSDIKNHLPRLKEIASKCQHVTEFGVRHGLSTWALMAGRPPTLVSYDIARCNMSRHYTAARNNQINYSFMIGDSAKIDIAPTDFLFIDSLHTGDHLRAELWRHHTKVRKYIACHDTEFYGEIGEDFKPGLMRSILDFVAAQNHWNIHRHYSDSNGMVVLKNAGA